MASISKKVEVKCVCCEGRHDNHIGEIEIFLSRDEDGLVYVSINGDDVVVTVDDDLFLPLTGGTP